MSALSVQRGCRRQAWPDLVDDATCVHKDKALCLGALLPLVAENLCHLIGAGFEGPVREDDDVLLDLGVDGGQFGGTLEGHVIDEDPDRLPLHQKHRLLLHGLRPGGTERADLTVRAQLAEQRTDLDQNADECSPVALVVVRHNLRRHSAALIWTEA